MEDMIKQCVKEQLSEMEERLINIVTMAKDQGHSEAIGKEPEVGGGEESPGAAGAAETPPLAAQPAAQPAATAATMDPWHAYGQPMSYGQPMMCQQGTRMLTPLDVKSLKKPSEYGGDTKLYLDWHEQFANFLAAKDLRWRKVLAGIEAKGFIQLKLEDEVEIARLSGLPGQLLSLKTQLYAYLQSYTKGSVVDLVSAGQEDRVFETYRQIADKGRSRRPEHVLELRNRVFQPTQNHPAGYKHAEVESKLAQWEADKRYFYQLTKEQISEDTVCLIAIKHTSGDLREHLIKEI